MRARVGGLDDVEPGQCLVHGVFLGQHAAREEPQAGAPGAFAEQEAGHEVVVGGNAQVRVGGGHAVQRVAHVAQPGGQGHELGVDVVGLDGGQGVQGHDGGRA